MSEKIMHLVSQETLFHYSCGNCRKWWSIAHEEQLNYITCPWCEHKAKVTNDHYLFYRLSDKTSDKTRDKENNTQQQQGETK